MQTAFPSSQYYGASVPSRVPSTGGGSCHLSLTGCEDSVATPGWFPRSPFTDWRVRRPAVPLQHRPGLPQHFPGPICRKLPVRQPDGAPSASTLQALHRPLSIRFEPLTCRGASITGSVSLHLPAFACDPEPSDSAGPFLRCQGCFRPSLHPQVRLPSASSDHCGDRWRISHPLGKPAPRGALE